MKETLFIRLLEAQDKEGALNRAIEALKQGETGSQVYSLDAKCFKEVPGSPFAYWVSQEIRELFITTPAFETENRTAVVGLQTSDDFRFVRAWWEVPEEKLGNHWFPFAKGGAYSPYYADVYLAVNWNLSGIEIREFKDPLTGKTYSRPQSIENYFRPGLTWPRRTTSGISSRVLPVNCVFADKGPSVFFAENSELDALSIMAIMQSQPFGLLISMQLAAADSAARSYEVGIIKKTPLPTLLESGKKMLANHAKRIWELRRGLDVTESSHAFALPPLLMEVGDSLQSKNSNWERRLKEVNAEIVMNQASINEYAYELYGMTEADREAILRGFPQPASDSTKDTADPSIENAMDDDEEESGEPEGLLPRTQSLLSWFVGAAFGRWDVRLATGERPFPQAPGPFDLLPSRAPGRIPEGKGEAFLVEDAGHGLDLNDRIRTNWKMVFGTEANARENEALRILDLEDIRKWLNHPQCFFEFHLKQYSKSKRKAPIYWPLSTASGSYTIWLYAPTVSSDTLFAAMNQALNPKIQRIQSEIQTLLGRENLDALDRRRRQDLVGLDRELTDFRDELVRVTQLPWKPDLNDGIQITAAPLWKCFLHKGWQKVLKKTWDDLENGVFDWSKMAMAVWPDRVRDKARTDRSLALAHGLKGDAA